MLEINQLQCPLCLGPNACGNTDTSITGCWCFQETIADELLEQIPQAAKGCLCICQECLKNHTTQTNQHVENES